MMVAQVNNEANTVTIGDFDTSLLVIREQVKGYIFSKETGDPTILSTKFT